MAKLTDEEFFWWQSVPEGKLTSLGIIHVDPAGCAREWSVLSDAEAQYQRTRFHEGVEDIARRVGAAMPPAWNGDQATLLIPDGDEPAPVRAFGAAKLLWERARVDLNLTGFHIAAHWAVIPWNPKPDETRDPAIEVCRNLARAAPDSSVAVSDDVFLALPDSLRGELAPLGITEHDRVATYVFPKSAAANKAAGFFEKGPDARLWDAFRAYAHSAEVRKLRYVGFRLHKKLPPTLDILDVFVPLEVEHRRRGTGADEFLRRRAAARGEVEETGPDDEVPFAGESEAVESRPFADLFRQGRGLVVLGEPGSGKSTLLRWLAVVAAGGRFNLFTQLGVAERRLPLPVSVGRLAEIRRGLGRAGSVIDALASYFHDRSVGQAEELKPFLRHSLDAGECLVLLDGLDEVRAEERDPVRGWLESFAAGFPRNRFVVSSRRVGYAGFDFPGAEEVTLRPFDDEQVKRYLHAFSRAYRHWETGADEQGPAEQAAQDLLHAIEESPRLHALARNPFLLSGIALMHRAEGRLPRHRVQFYEIFARCLCEAWGDARRIVAGDAKRQIPYEEEAIPILGKLAYEMHCRFPAGRAPRDFVVRTLKATLQERQGVADHEALGAASRFLQRASDEVALFLERGPDEWGFLHLTFQEFFAAAWLHAEEKFQDFALQHWWEARWEEVIRLGVGYMAIVQKRPAAVGTLIREFCKAKCESRPWVTDKLRLQVPFVTLLAAEAGEALPRGLQTQIAEAFASWHSGFDVKLAGRVLREVALTDFQEQLSAIYVALLASESWATRAAAAYALGQLRAETALGPLLEALRDPHGYVRWRAAHALGQVRAGAALGPLLEALRDQDTDLRRSAAYALGQLRAEAAVGPLLGALRDQDADVRGRAAYALGQLRAEAALGPLLEALRDPERNVRGRAACALGQLSAETALRPLLEAFRDQDPVVRVSAAEALGQLRAKAALGPLLEALRDQDEDVRRSAPYALGQLRAEAALGPLLEALRDPERNVRGRAAQALGQLRAEAALGPLVEALRDQDGDVRWRAAEALGELRAEAALGPLLEALRDPNRYVRGRAAEALGQLRAEAAVGPIVEALRDPEVSVRGRAASALGQLRSEKAIGNLLKALRDNNWLVRERAADALIAILASLPPSR